MLHTKGISIFYSIFLGIYMQYITNLAVYYFGTFHRLIKLIFSQTIKTEANMGWLKQNFERKLLNVPLCCYLLYCSGMGGGWLQTEEGDPPQFFIYPPLILLYRPLIGSLGSTTASPSPHPQPPSPREVRDLVGRRRRQRNVKWGGGMDSVIKLGKHLSQV